MKVTVAMLGARMHYAVPRLLYEAGLLERFFTDSYIGNKPFLECALRAVPNNLAPPGLLRWLGRKDAVLPAEKIESFETLGLWYAWARSRTSTNLEAQAVSREAAQRFNREILRVGLGDAHVVWGFSNASLELFQAAKEQGRQCILEQASLPAELEASLMRQELLRWPRWQPGLELPESDRAAIQREMQEWELADCIVGGSDFVRVGLETCGVAASKIRVVPYGVDVTRFAAAESCQRGAGEPLRVLFAGAVGLQKGVPDLLHALAKLGRSKVEAKLAGRVALAHECIAPFSEVATFLGPVPRAQIPDLYRWADVFVLPSIAEGSATVIYEALMTGIPVVTTPNSGSIVEDRVNGFVVPIRDPDALAEAIGRYANDRDLLTRHRMACVHSRARAGLDRYRADLLGAIFSVTSHRNGITAEETSPERRR